jgi:BlaI family transcriptional regulator, penicillinase repressor
MSKPTPTRSELKLLHMLWEQGPATVREIHDQIAEESGVSYTTVLKQFQIMHEKGLVQRETGSRAHKYSAIVDRDETCSGLLGDFLERVYQGSASELVIQALGMSRPASQAELDEIQRLIDSMKSRSEKPGGAQP